MPTLARWFSQLPHNSIVFSKIGMKYNEVHTGDHKKKWHYHCFVPIVGVIEQVPEISVILCPLAEP